MPEQAPNPAASGSVFHFSATRAGLARRASRALGGWVRGLGLVAVLGLAAVGAHAQQVLRVTAIPDESPTELARKFEPLGQYLQQELGMAVQWTPVTDYAAAVETLANRKVDLAWFGGFTFVQAQQRSQGKAVPLVQRQEDAQFRSVFITRAGSGIESLADLKGRTLAFGSQSSTSGHLMPRHYLLAQGINPDADLKRVSFSGAHDATIAAVASGKVDAGALNISVWEKFVAEGRVDANQVRVLYTTPAYHDYNWTVHADMPAELQEKIRQAFLKLDAAEPAGKAILELQRATRFIPTEAANYDGIRAAAQSAGLLR
ncbi:putative selenate ABC transporter substrate-binding protein [Vandammella animalimorsus]|uniref:Putative selenate ABC transporter substrate-binding protein n=1 Tax=Vandammella animalimorsus TaxID=2029117 RepID=A0A2A2AYY3_9BURK|nr:putative selenate ABC transporter substrate-binding protein [Vandammella animalimorsus]